MLEKKILKKNENNLIGGIKKGKNEHKMAQTRMDTRGHVYKLLNIN
jgi:hypothetical protein